MQYTAILLMCLFALATAAQQDSKLTNLLKSLIAALDNESDGQKAISAPVPYGGTTVGRDFVDLKIIRDMSEVNADKIKNKEPLYSFMYGEGTYDAATVGHAAESYIWKNLATCATGQQGCHKISNLKPGTKYWFQLEVEMHNGNGYEYVDSRKHHMEFTTTA